MYCGMRPLFNAGISTAGSTYSQPKYSGLTVTSGNVNAWRDWHHMYRLVDQVGYTTSSAGAIAPMTNADATALTPTSFTPAGANMSTSVTQVSRSVFPVVTKTINTISVLAHGITVYGPDFPVEFFSLYEPWNYGGWNIVTPDDEGAFMINFALYPGTYQPSGHINISRAREFFFQYNSSFIGSQDLNDPTTSNKSPCNLLVIASAINFLLISDGSAVLRYST